MTNTEIEKKFLVTSTEFLKQPHTQKKLLQGYLCSEPSRTVRIRTDGISGYITIKGETHGITRKEYEYTIPLKDAEELIQMCNEKIVKTRHYIPMGKHTYEVDVFEDKNKGLIVAEIELESETENFIKPQWLGKEVSQDPRYYNSQLTKKPYCEWIEN
ncbi:hypothetical protein ENUP19_0082G0091 [Entamoeba nuttalli]|uniref:Adenylate cyclase domain containing protein n=2 Tax=Entamoeba nuttalli TaxID=412467 RepID=K2H645_ENTNP|nr:adenylate cyclase domain containing protein [Entamoeba nuttalli P19]EKE41927.1 adenylate cyclase domain containing protein [Entamoeba nuttalli P19]|eukprot:XP_008855728.1 adenylate cyclase domain containing protein [Entamoeba nuttalli P19]